MKHLQLQPRLRLLADMVPAGAHLADIGTDHGYLPVWLMQQGLNGMHVWHCPHTSKPGEAETHYEMLKLLETSIQASHAGMPR